jgi:CubicO group peptidase (beta-lactamase class C family)
MSVLGRRLSSFLSLLALAAATTLSSPAKARDPLPRGEPEAEGVDPVGVLRFVNVLESKIHSVHSLMLVRHGKVVAEGWWAPYTASDRHIMYSATKSFTSTAVGLASQEGKLDIRDLVLQHFPELAPKAPAEQMKHMRIFDLLRMNTGHQNDMLPLLEARKDGQLRRAFLESPVEFKPGTRFVYNSAATYMLAAIVQQVSGTTLEEYLKPRLFEPLGIDDYYWGKSAEGVNVGQGGLMLHTEDLAKFGLLYLQKGVWQGKRLLSEHWVREATARQTATGGDPGSNWDYGYGFQFWQNKVTGYRADGAFGQFSMVLPEYDAVIAITSGTPDMGGVMDTVWDALLPALRPQALPTDVTARTRLKEKLAGLSLPVQSGAPTAELAAGVSKAEYAFPKNEMNLERAGVDFSGAAPVIHFHDPDGEHDIPCGLAEWKRSTTAYQRRIAKVFSGEQHGVAASCGWTDDHTFVAKLCFYETPYTVTHTFGYSKGQLTLDLEHNVRWGATKRPRLTGKRLAQPTAAKQPAPSGPAGNTPSKPKAAAL